MVIDESRVCTTRLQLVKYQQSYHSLLWSTTPYKCRTTRCVAIRHDNIDGLHAAIAYDVLLVSCRCGPTLSSSQAKAAETSGTRLYYIANTSSMSLHLTRYLRHDFWLLCRISCRRALATSWARSSCRCNVSECLRIYIPWHPSKAFNHLYNQVIPLLRTLLVSLQLCTRGGIH